jgi:hypothetical protein
MSAGPGATDELPALISGLFLYTAICVDNCTTRNILRLMATPESWDGGGEVASNDNRQRKIDKIIADEMLMAQLMGQPPNSLDLSRVIAYEVDLAIGTQPKPANLFTSTETLQPNVLPDNVIQLRPLNGNDTAA